MGSVLSADDPLEFDAADEYTRWSLDNVREAHERFAKLRRHHQVTVNRRQFFEVFTDYTVMVDGAFLSLPMEHFDLYDAKSTNEVFVYEVFFMLAVFCKGTEDEKVSFAFQLFDFRGVGHITGPDMVMLMQAIMSATKKLGVVKRVPNERQLERLAMSLFKDADKNVDDKVELEEWRVWVESNLESREVLDRYTKVAETAADKVKRIEAERAAKRKAYRAKKAKLEEARRKEESEGKVAKRRSSATRLHSEALGGDLLLREKRTRAMKLKTIMRGKVMLDLAESSRFTKTELTLLAKQFAEVSGADMRISPDTFKELFVKHMPRLTDVGTVEKLYVILDDDGDGSLDYSEFALGLSKCLRGGLDDKLRLMFDMYDRDKSGAVEVSELILMVQAGKSDLDDLFSFAAEVINSFDRNGDGQIDQHEFTEAIERELGLMEAFEAGISVTVAIADAMAELTDGTPTLTPDALKHAVLRYRETGRLMTDEVDLEDFAELCKDYLDCTDAQDEQIRGAFAAIAGRGVEKVVLRDALNAMMQAVSDDDATHVLFWFWLADIDGDGSLGKEEVLHLLVSSKARADKNAREVHAALMDLDDDKDGVVTFDEFYERARTSPVLMAVLQTMFRVHRGSTLGAKRMSGL